MNPENSAPQNKKDFIGGMCPGCEECFPKKSGKVYVELDEKGKFRKRDHFSQDEFDRNLVYEMEEREFESR